MLAACFQPLDGWTILEHLSCRSGRLLSNSRLVRVPSNPSQMLPIAALLTCLAAKNASIKAICRHGITCQKVHGSIDLYCKVRIRKYIVFHNIVAGCLKDSNQCPMSSFNMYSDTNSRMAHPLKRGCEEVFGQPWKDESLVILNLE